jgi:prepilin-type N-terminal cleavage/methylation domain-containing protein
MKKNGFSLIECLITLAIVTLIIALASFNFSFYQRYILHTQVEKLYSLCIHLQQEAITHNQIVSLTLDEKNHCCSTGTQCMKLAQGIMFGFIPSSKGPPSSPTCLICKPITFEANIITFYPSGIIQAGTLYLCDERKKNMYALCNAPGHVSFLRKYRYDGKWQIIV